MKSEPFKVKIAQIKDACAVGGISLISSCKTSNTRMLVPSEVIWVLDDDSTISTQIRNKAKKYVEEGILVITKDPATRPYYFSSTEVCVSSKPTRNTKAALELREGIAKSVVTADKAFETEMANRSVAMNMLGEKATKRGDQVVDDVKPLPTIPRRRSNG